MNLHSIEPDIILDYLRTRWPEHTFRRRDTTHVEYTGSDGRIHLIPDYEWATSARTWHREGRPPWHRQGRP